MYAKCYAVSKICQIQGEYMSSMSLELEYIKRKKRYKVQGWDPERIY